MLRKFLVIALMLSSAAAFAADDFKTIWSKPLDFNISSVAFSKDSRYLMTAGGNGIFVYDVETSELVNNNIKTPVNQLIMSKDGSHIYAHLINRIGSYNTTTWQDESNFEMPNKYFGALSISPDGKYLAAPTDSGFVIWDVETGKIVKEKTIPKDPKAYKRFFSYVLINCENSKVYLAGYDEYHVENPKPNVVFNNYVKVYDFNSLDSIDCLTKGFKLSNDCKIMAIRDTSGFRLYNFYDMKEISFLYIQGNVTGSCFTSDYKYFLVSSGIGDYGIYMFNVETGELVKKREYGGLYNLTISPDEHFIGTSSGNSLYLHEFNYTSGVEQPQSEKEILYPNPTTGTIEIKLEEQPVSDVSMELLDASGNLKAILSSSDITQSENTLRLSLGNVPSGAYFIRLTGLNFSKTYKVVITK